MTEQGDPGNASKGLERDSEPTASINNGVAQPNANNPAKKTKASQSTPLPSMAEKYRTEPAEA